MKIHGWLLGFGIVLGCLVPHVALARDLKITCMEMLQGVPSEPVTYTLKEETGELLSSNYPDGPLSKFQEAPLGHTTTKLGASTSYSSHQWNKPGETLQRTVKHVPDKGSKEKPWNFVQIYDFNRQTVISGNDKADSCHHRLYKGTE